MESENKTYGMAAPRISLDLVIEILVLLPVKSVVLFKCVCKEWYNLISKPLFVKLHLNKSLEPKSRRNCILYWTNNTLCVVDELYHPFKVTKLNWPITIRDDDRIYRVGSCNGLVCFKVTCTRITMSYRIRRFLICNPTTRTFKSIRPLPGEIWGADSLSYGFGYDSEHDDYKIVVTRCFLMEDDRNNHVFIYSLKTELWSSPSPLPRVSTGGRWSIISGVTFGHNNMLHYLVSHVTGGIQEDYRIARFDVAYDKWTDDLSLPVQERSFARLGNLDGRLYVHVLDHDLRSSDVWILEEDSSWTKMFNLSQDLYENYQLLKDHVGEEDVLKWYQQRDNTRMPLKLAPRPEGGSKTLLCIASLIRIPGCSLTMLQAKKE